MSQPSELELSRFNQVADQLREVFAERGHRVDVAMEADPAFGSGWSRAAVTRDLAVDAASGAGSRVGIDFRPVNGSGREFRCLSGTIDRRYRFRRATRRLDGSLLVAASSDSALASSECESLFDEEQWVLAWTLSPDGLIDEVVIAEVVGYVEGVPGHLRLGPEFPLGGTEVPPGGFRPVDEDLDGFDDEGELGGEFGPSS